MRIATWNVNSIRQRLDHLLTWLRDCAPTSSACREIKCVDEGISARSHRAARLQCRHPWPEDLSTAWALLSKYPLEEATPRLVGDEEDVHARFLEGVVSLKSGVVRVACL